MATAGGTTLPLCRLVCSADHLMQAQDIRKINRRGHAYPLWIQGELPDQPDQRWRRRIRCPVRQ